MPADADTRYVMVPIDRVVVGPRLRVQSDVTSLRDSIEHAGLLNPITLTPDWRLIAGAHRLEACRQLGWTHIPASIRDMDELSAELAEIDENLTQHHLTILEQGEHLVRRNEILRQLGLRAERGDNRYTTDRGEDSAPLQKTSDIATRAGMGERTAQERMQVARTLPIEVRDAIRATAVANSYTDLMTLTHLSADERSQVAEAIRDGRARSVSEARRQLAATTADDDDEDSSEGAVAIDVADHLRVVRLTLSLRYQAPNPQARSRVVNGQVRHPQREALWMEPDWHMPFGPTEESRQECLQRLTAQADIMTRDALRALRALQALGVGDD